MLQSEWRTMGWKGRQCVWHLAAIKISPRVIEFWIGIDTRAGLETVGPAVMFAVFDGVKGVGRAIHPEVIGTHVRCVELAVYPAKTDRIAQTAREVMLVLAVRIHLKNAGANFFLLFTGIATASDSDIDLSIAAGDHRARQMPATVFVAESVVRKSCQHLRLARRSVLAGLVTITHKTIG